MMTRINFITIGEYRGMIADEYAGILAEPLCDIKKLISSPDAVVLAEGRNKNVLVDIPYQEGVLKVVVKSFGREPRLKNLIDNYRGSKACRTWLVARHLHDNSVGTPEPVAFMELWQGRRLLENYFISVYQAGMSDFAAELSNLFYNEPECVKVINLLQTVADGVAALHNSGCMHNDMGNQNIMLSRTGADQWENVKFIDLNRADIKESLSYKQRARDISRIWLPSDLLRVFIEMYFGGKQVPPVEFLKREKFYRKQYAVHAATRKWRHPIKYYRRRGQKKSLLYPEPRDLWIWDERSAQPIVMMKSKERHKYYSASWIVQPVMEVLRGTGKVWAKYKKLKDKCFHEQVMMYRRVGISIEPRENMWQQQFALLSGLGQIPVMIRFGHYESDAVISFKLQTVRNLANDGFQVSIALLQDRHAITDTVSWRRFVKKVLTDTVDYIEFVEVGHAINRVKWGVWSFKEYQGLLSGIADIAAGFEKDIRFTGPAVIDFEYPFVLAALKNMPDNFTFNALSHHLYVDRRGAPENKQGRFDSLDKFIFGRAIAELYPFKDNKFIVSEVNWPIVGTGVYSPVGAPYVSPGERKNDPGVTEWEYACFMIRYLAIALTSGMVERVYWWRMIAHGFGLVDDIDILRKRPAYYALKVFLDILGQSIFKGRISGLPENVYALNFFLSDGSKVCLAWVHGDDFELSVEYSELREMTGEVKQGDGKRVQLTGTPVYIWYKR